MVLAIGIVSALGAQTPFGHLLFLIPFVKDERLLNRNILLVDFSLAMLFAWWVHLLLAERAGKGRAPRVPLRARWRPGGRAELVATCVPFAVALVLCAWAWLGGSALERALGAQFVPPSATRLAVAGIMTGGVVIAASATWIVLHAERFAARDLRRLLAVVLTVDLIAFNVWVLRPPVSLTLGRAQGPMATAFTHLVGDGRFLIYDPDQFEGDQLRELGQTDLNVFNSLPSGQGYAALTDGGYYDATGAHYQEDLAPAEPGGNHLGRPQRVDPAQPPRLLHDAGGFGAGRLAGVVPGRALGLQRRSRGEDRSGDAAHWSLSSLVLRIAADAHQLVVRRTDRGSGWAPGGAGDGEGFRLVAPACRRPDRPVRGGHRFERPPGSCRGSGRGQSRRGNGGGLDPDRADHRDRRGLTRRPAAVRRRRRPLGVHGRLRLLRHLPEHRGAGLGVGGCAEPGRERSCGPTRA